MNKGATRHRMVHVDPICVECGKLGKLKSGKEAYPRKPEKHQQAFYVCVCGALVSCHPGTAVAAGRPGSSITRGLRWKAHTLFDKLWMGADGDRTRVATGFARRRAYKWLARELGRPANLTHIGWMSAEECRLVIAACEARLNRKEAA